MVVLDLSLEVLQFLARVTDNQAGQLLLGESGGRAVLLRADLGPILQGRR